ncbi:MAG: hypothetical protein KDD70_02780 [Bdellovibrionales bacterium]|nr:hypothetical protein [Bdellovibrionales bacterium]
MTIWNEKSHAFLRKFNRKTTSGGLLDGLRFVIKDNISLAGFPTSWGFSPPAIPVASHTAPAVDLLLSQGAICIGSTNLDIGAIGARGKNPYYGEMRYCSNPSQKVYGSSGGAAIAIGEGASDFALVTDVAGSSRLPAIPKRLWGLKLKSEEAPTRGILRYHPTIDSLGIIAGEYEILARVLESLKIGKSLNVITPLRLELPKIPHLDSGKIPAFIKDAERIPLENFPLIKKARHIHQSLIARSVRHVFRRLPPKSSDELRALNELPMEKGDLDLNNEHQDLVLAAEQAFPKPSALLSFFPARLKNVHSTLVPLLLVSNLLDWPALIVPFDKQILVHITGNTTSFDLLAISSELTRR